MSYRVRFTPEAEADLLRLYEFLLSQDLAAAEAALATITKAIRLLEDFPFACRKAAGADAYPTLRELLIAFGSSGYVALFDIDTAATVTILAVRHQREDDYH